MFWSIEQSFDMLKRRILKAQQDVDIVYGSVQHTDLIFPALVLYIVCLLVLPYSQVSFVSDCQTLAGATLLWS